MKIKECLKCEEEFDPKHGNENYCKKKKCQYEAKKERQAKNYLIGKDAKLAIQKNHKILQHLLADANMITVDLMKVLKMGFDQNGYYGSYITADTNIQAYEVHDIRFNISTDNPKKIKIWKIKKQ